METMKALRKAPQWEYPLEVLKERSPSLRDGFSYGEELKLFNRAIRFLVTVCEHLQLPSVTIFTAVTYMHRFYTRFSHKYAHGFNIAGGCVFLAAKTEETPRRLKEVAAVCAKIGLQKPNMQNPEESREYNKWLSVIPQFESMLLEALYFDLDVKSPYTFLRAQLHKIGMENAPELHQKAQQLMNEGCKTLVQSIYKPEVVSASNILWASVSLGQKIPDVNGSPWWVVLDTNRDNLVEAVNTAVDMLNAVKKTEEVELARIQ